MYSEKMESLILSVIADGEITQKERAVLHKNAEAEGVDIDELDVYVDGLLALAKKELAKSGPVVAPSPVMSNFENDEKQPTSYEKLTNKLEEIDKIFGGRLDKALNRSGFSKALAIHEDEVEVREEWRTRKYTAIIEHQLPSSKEEMLELLTSIKPNVDMGGPKNGYYSGSDEKEDMGLAYWKLFEKGVELSRQKFDAEDFTSIYNFYESELKKKKWKRNPLVQMFKFLSS